MTNDERMKHDFMETIRGVRKSCWSRDGNPAPHKPLLFLLALGRLRAKKSRLVLYQSLEDPLTKLLREFAPKRSKHGPELPFWHLKTRKKSWKMKLWEIPGSEALQEELTEGFKRDGRRRRATPDRLKRYHLMGGVPKPLYDLLQSNPELLQEAVKVLLYDNFPETWHDDILSAVGLSLDHEESVDRGEPGASGSKRNPRFREEVLRAYGRSCAVCNFDVRLDDNLFGLEAAHIKWHAAGGPDEVVNGLALCSAHHRAFDRGALGFVQDNPTSYRVVVSDLVSGLSNAAQELQDLHWEPLRGPRNDDHLPDSGYIEWHRKQIFRGKVISGG